MHLHDLSDRAMLLTIAATSAMLAMSTPATNTYDCIIVGSGLGGLSAGAMLAKYGKSVLVCEAHSIPGGCAHSFERSGFSFDSGPSLWSLRHTVAQSNAPGARCD